VFRFSLDLRAGLQPVTLLLLATLSPALASAPLTAEEARDILREAPGCMVVDKRENGGYVTPIEAVGEYATYVSRIREDATIENGLNLWVVSDNLRKGAALNTVQIAEALINRGLLQQAA
jgi:aspartate-semialdehyde dehydrogenase